MQSGHGLTDCKPPRGPPATRMGGEGRVRPAGVPTASASDPPNRRREASSGGRCSCNEAVPQPGRPPPRPRGTRVLAPLRGNSAAGSIWPPTSATTAESNAIPQPSTTRFGRQRLAGAPHRSSSWVPSSVQQRCSSRLLRARTSSSVARLSAATSPLGRRRAESMPTVSCRRCRPAASTYRLRSPCPWAGRRRDTFARRPAPPCGRAYAPHTMKVDRQPAHRSGSPTELQVCGCMSPS